MRHTTLEHASDLITDGTHGSPKRTKELNGIPLLSAKNVFDGEVRWDAFDRVPSSEWEVFNKRVSLKRGDVLMTCVGTIGRAAVWLNEKPVVLFRSVAIIRPKPSLSSNYLEYVIRSNDFQAELRRRTKRSSQGGVYLNDIKTMPIAVPALLEQERIVTLLDEADELRKLRDQADRRTAALIPSLFDEMFGDPAENAKGWKMRSVSEMAEVQGGLQLSPIRDTYPLHRPYLRVANVQRGSLILDEIKEIGLLASEYERVKLKTGDVLLVEGNGNPREVGRAAIWNGVIDGVVHQNHLIRVRPRADVLIPDYLLTFVNSESGRLYFHGSGNTTSGLVTISTSIVKNCMIPMPPLSLQKEFAAHVAEIRAMEAEQTASRRRLDDLFQSLLHRAFNGEL